VTEGQVTIAPIRAQEIYTALEIERRSFTSDVWDAEGYVNFLGNGGDALFAYYEGIPAGVLWFDRSVQETIDCISLAVFPYLRSKGIARKLYEAILDLAKREAITYLTLQVRPSNTEALEWYKRLGFVESKREPGYYEDGEEAIHMVQVIQY
jgi:[ribosomal protein S18]-alanine N-acetyltransferase